MKAKTSERRKAMCKGRRLLSVLVAGSVLPYAAEGSIQASEDITYIQGTVSGSQMNTQMSHTTFLLTIGIRCPNQQD